MPGCYLNNFRILFHQVHVYFFKLLTLHPAGNWCNMANDTIHCNNSNAGKMQVHPKQSFHTVIFHTGKLLNSFVIWQPQTKPVMKKLLPLLFILTAAACSKSGDKPNDLNPEKPTVTFTSSFGSFAGGVDQGTGFKFSVSNPGTLKKLEFYRDGASTGPTMGMPTIAL